MPNTESKSKSYLETTVITFLLRMRDMSDEKALTLSSMKNITASPFIGALIKIEEGFIRHDGDIEEAKEAFNQRFDTFEILYGEFLKNVGFEGENLSNKEIQFSSFSKAKDLISQTADKFNKTSDRFDELYNTKYLEGTLATKQQTRNFFKDWENLQNKNLDTVTEKTNNMGIILNEDQKSQLQMILLAGGNLRENIQQFLKENFNKEPAEGLNKAIDKVEKSNMDFYKEKSDALEKAAEQANKNVDKLFTEIKDISNEVTEDEISQVGKELVTAFAANNEFGFDKVIQEIKEETKKKVLGLG